MQKLAHLMSTQQNEGSKKMRVLDDCEIAYVSGAGDVRDAGNLALGLGALFIGAGAVVTAPAIAVTAIVVGGVLAIGGTSAVIDDIFYTSTGTSLFQGNSSSGGTTLPKGGKAPSNKA